MDERSETLGCVEVEIAKWRREQIDNIKSTLKIEYEKSNKMRTRYKCVIRIISGVNILNSVLSTAGIAASVGMAFSGVGIVVSGPLGILAAICGALNTGGIIAVKRISKRASKHVAISSLAKSSDVAVTSLLNKAYEDGKIGTNEFEMILEIKRKYDKAVDILEKKETDDILSGLQVQSEVAHSDDIKATNIVLRTQKKSLVTKVKE